MANICDNTLTVTGPAEERRRLVQLWTDDKPVFNRILPVSEDDEQYYLKWGTKWDVGGGWNHAYVQEHEDKVTIGFDTAWAPPLPVIKAMSVLYPELKFHLVYFEPGERFAGEARFFDGYEKHDRYEDDDPQYRRIASELGWDEDEE